MEELDANEGFTRSRRVSPLQKHQNFANGVMPFLLRGEPMKFEGEIPSWIEEALIEAFDGKETMPWLKELEDASDPDLQERQDVVKWFNMNSEPFGTTYGKVQSLAEFDKRVEQRANNV